MARAGSPERSRLLLLIIAYLGFISLGLPDTLIGVAWPSVRESFDLPQSAIALVFFGAGSAYFVSGVFAGRAVNRLGVGLLLAVSSGIVAFGEFGFALAPFWVLFAGCSLLHGLGSGAIDAGLNYYVAHHFSVRHMNWLHAFWSLGATLGPLIMTAAVARNQWRMGYGTVGIILFSMALLFLLTRKKWEEPGPPPELPGEAVPLAEPVPGAVTAMAEAQEAQPAAARVGMRDAVRHPVVWLQVMLFFFYTGAEATLGQWGFTLLTESRGFAEESAGLWVTIYWASIGGGRILLGMVAARIGIDRLVRISTATALVGTVLYASSISPEVSALALVLCGFGLATVYPSLMTRTPQRLGSALAAHSIGFQVSAATAGAAVLPSTAGVLAQHYGLEMLAYTAVAMAVVVWGLHEVLVRRAG